MIHRINNEISVLFTDEGFGKSNSLLVDDDIRVMIDSGSGQITLSAEPEKVDILLNSHCHIDHVWDNDLFVNARILAHPLERENFKDSKKIGSLDSWDRYMDDDPGKYVHQIATMKQSFENEWRVDGTIGEGDVIDAGKTRIHVMHMPGHTSGHLSFFFPGTGLLFCGDICLTKVGPWYGDSVTPIDDFIKSIKRIIDLKPEKVVSGHNREVLSSDIRGAFEDYMGRIEKREQKVYAAIRERPSTINELAERMLIYPAHPTIFVRYWEKAMLAKHLQRLVKNGTADFDQDGRYHGK